MKSNSWPVHALIVMIIIFLTKIEFVHFLLGLFFKSQKHFIPIVNCSCPYFVKHTVDLGFSENKSVLIHAQRCDFFQSKFSKFGGFQCSLNNNIEERSCKLAAMAVAGISVLTLKWLSCQGVPLEGTPPCS